MGPFFFLIIAFFVAFLCVYAFMRITCFLKKKYALVENKIWKFLLSLMCESCREACKDHKKLIVRAMLFSLVIAAVATATYYIR